jgi:hypothetical protein
MAASDALHPDLFGGKGVHHPVPEKVVGGPVHGPAEPPLHGPPKPRTSEPDFGKPGPGVQLPMFMSAKEITAQYEPNAPDRLFHGTTVSVGVARGVRLNAGPDPRAGEWTGRDERTDGVVNNFVADRRGNYHPQRPTNIDLKGEWAQPETDEQLYARKYAESRAPKRGGATTTFSSIAEEGVRMPIALGHEEGTGRPDFVAGGHHRIAVMNHLNADQLLPVVHVRSVGEAGDFESKTTMDEKVRSATAKEKRQAQGNFVQRQEVHTPPPEEGSRFG